MVKVLTVKDVIISDREFTCVINDTVTIELKRCYFRPPLGAKGETIPRPRKGDKITLCQEEVDGELRTTFLVNGKKLYGSR